MKTSQKASIRVPRHVRHRLQPYATIFEEVVIPLARKVNTDTPSGHVKVQLREALEQRQREFLGVIQHPALIHYALLLCCYHTCSEALRPRQGRKISRSVLKLGRKAFVLIEESYQHYNKEDSLLFV